MDAKAEDGDEDEDEEKLEIVFVLLSLISCRWSPADTEQGL